MCLADSTKRCPGEGPAELEEGSCSWSALGRITNRLNLGQSMTKSRTVCPYRLPVSGMGGKVSYTVEKSTGPPRLGNQNTKSEGKVNTA